MPTNDPLPLDAAEIAEELPGLALRSTVVFPFDVVSPPFLVTCLVELLTDGKLFKFCCS